MRTRGVALLASLGRRANASATLKQAQRLRLTPQYASASTYTARTITTKSKNRSPSMPMAERISREEEEEGMEWVVESNYTQDYSLPANATAAAYVLQDASKWAHKTAMECGITGRRYTYGELVDGAMRFGGLLQRLAGPQAASQPLSGTTVAVLAPNCPEYPSVFFGTLAVGAKATPINPTYMPGEVASHLEDSGATLVVVDELMEPLIDAALKMLKKDIMVIINGTSKGGRPNLREIISDPNTPFATHVEIPPDSVATMPYSSGTTGKAKGVCIQHSAFCNSLAMSHHPKAFVIAPAEGSHQEVFVGLLPFFHIYGMMVLMSSGVMKGAKVITLPKFDPKTYIGILSKNKVTTLHLVPAILNFLAMSPMVPASVLASANSVLCGAAPVSPSAASLLKEKAQRPIFFQEGFGMTETLCTHITPQDDERLGYCGTLMAHVRAKVVDIETGKALPPGHRGELCLESPGAMASYHNNPEATRESFDADGFFKTGDIATYDEDGYFCIVDRIKELIKVKGLQVAPSELESLLLTHPGVAEAGVVGVADQRAGEVPRAYVVPRTKGITEEDIKAFVSSRVSPHKQLAGGVAFVDSLPKNITGKILRRELKRMSEEEQQV